jgi:hypothetical protein
VATQGGHLGSMVKGLVGREAVHRGKAVAGLPPVWFTKYDWLQYCPL